MTTARRPGTIRASDARPGPYRPPSPDALAIAPAPLREAFDLVERLDRERTEVVAEVERARRALDNAYDTSVMHEAELRLSGLHHRLADARAGALDEPQAALDEAERSLTAVALAYGRARGDLVDALARYGPAWAEAAKVLSDKAIVEAGDLLASFEEKVGEAMLGHSVRGFVRSSRERGKLMFTPRQLADSVVDATGTLVEVVRASERIADLHRLLAAAAAALEPDPEPDDEPAAPPQPGRVIESSHGALVMPEHPEPVDDDNIEVDD